MKKLSLAVVFLCAALTAFGGESTETALKTRAKEHLINLVNINTAQPEGNEIKAARYIYKVLNKHGLDWDIYQPEKGRANIISVIKGSNPKLPPLILLSHLDTVSASGAWTEKPFWATEKDGKIYGLGTIDDKNNTAVFLTIFTWIKYSGLIPERDIVFLATADEEAGSKKGLLWLADNGLLDKFKGGYAINEGGSILNLDGKTIFFVETATKAYMDVKMTAYGSAGHSATTENNAVYILTEAIKKVQNMEIPYTLSPVTKKFFEDIYPLQDDDAKTTIDMLLSENPDMQKQAAAIISEDPFFRTQLKDTISPTIITSAGTDENALAPSASVILNCRLLPTTDPDAFVQRIKEIFAEDPNIFIEVVDKPQFPFPSPSSDTTELFGVIKAIASHVYPDSKMIAGMTPTSSDSETLRRMGINTYGLGIFGSDQSGVSAPRAHAPDEYIEEDEFYKQLNFIMKTIYAFALGTEAEDIHDHKDKPEEAEDLNTEEN
ncbi:Acetylornithine deacetylase/Succinyl-diaminopimelate desuccinylase [Parelusimicrobium proximum]|uniref:M20/M25/M40 family metallo-hydrolase n=1 Tax=Parelusimicrobium proximum TaxID=3228953 RepID=UPI003D16D88E